MDQEPEPPLSKLHYTNKYSTIGELYKGCANLFQKTIKGIEKLVKNTTIPNIPRTSNCHRV